MNKLDGLLAHGPVDVADLHPLAGDEHHHIKMFKEFVPSHENVTEQERVRGPSQ